MLSSEDYQPLASRVFDAIAARLAEALPGARVEHVGSSSIHGAASKGDLDIFVAVPPDAFEAAVPRIVSLGFAVKEDSLRTEALCPFWSDAWPLDVGIQLVANGSRFEFFLTFRDRLNADPSLVRAYNDLKRSAATLAPDDYRRVKSRFIEDVLSGRDPRGSAAP